MTINATITINANELLQYMDDKDVIHPYYITKWILYFISNYCDPYIMNINVYYVAFISAIILGIIRYIFGNKYGIDSCAFIHAIITSIGAILCWYLDTYYYITISSNTDVNQMIWYEPNRSIIQCLSPLTSIHRILPAITLGYSILDFIHGLSLGYDFLFHGIITMIVMGYVVINEIPQSLSSFILMEVSTIFLSCLRCTEFSETLSLLNTLCFVLSFFIFRIIMVPYLWYKLMYVIISNHNTYQYGQCFGNIHFMEYVFVTGMMFHLLNVYWFYKILLKIQRKLSGHEKVHENNDIVTTNKKEDDDKKVN